MSWQHQILRVNLSDLSCAIEPLNEEWAQAYLGQRGLGTKYLYEEIDPGVDPLSPENKLIFATGPLTGTMASTGGRYSVITKGALTNAIACSNSGGQFGAELKLAGYDLLILEARRRNPFTCISKTSRCACSLPATCGAGPSGRRKQPSSGTTATRSSTSPRSGPAPSTVAGLPVWSTTCTGPPAARA